MNPEANQTTPPQTAEPGAAEEAEVATYANVEAGRVQVLQGQMAVSGARYAVEGAQVAAARALTTSLNARW